MGIGISILLLAVGAILAFAVHVTASGFSIQTVGIILMVVGGVGLLAAVAITGLGGWGGLRRSSSVEESYVDPANPGRRTVRRRDTYVN
ncbi:MAG: DUF6458 family protein [Acidimicrobiales bacterium]